MTEHFQKNEMKGSVLRSDQKRKQSVHQGAFSHQTDSECWTSVVDKVFKKLVTVSIKV